MKARINLILCLLLIAITISLIAVSFGWYSAAVGNIFVEESSVTITTADNDFYTGGANFEFVATMSRESLDATTFDVHYSETEQKTLKHPYYGEDGVFNEYILLIRMDKNADDGNGNPLANNGDAYIQSVALTLGVEPIYLTYDTNDAYKADFQILYVSYNGTDKATITDRTEGTPEYIALIFGNGSSLFRYSSNKYFGYKFNIYMNYYTE